MIFLQDIVMDIITILLESVYGSLGSVSGQKQACKNKVDKPPDSDGAGDMKDSPQMLNNSHEKGAPQDCCPSQIESLSLTTDSILEPSSLAVMQKSAKMVLNYELDQNLKSSVGSKPEKAHCSPHPHQPGKFF